VEDVALLVGLDLDAQLGGGGQLGRVGEREQADLVERIRGIRDQLPKLKKYKVLIKMLQHGTGRYRYLEKNKFLNKTTYRMSIYVYLIPVPYKNRYRYVKDRAG
jgi:hypothetical protein